MKDKLRMFEWFVVSLVLLIAIWFTAPQQLGVSLYKLSLITTAAWIGYWIDRSLFPYARPDQVEGDSALDSRAGNILASASMIRRAIIVGAAMLAASLGA